MGERVIFWDVDTQHDFMDADGRLYVPGAESIKSNLKRLTDYAHERGIRIVASSDDHTAEHREISSTPDFRLLAAPLAVTIGGQRMIKFIYDSTAAGAKPLKVTTVRYYVPKNEAMVAVVTYRDAATEFDSSEADSILSTFKWL